MASGGSLGGPAQLGVVILAAGAGSRLGGVAKATLVHDGATYLERILALCDAVGVSTRIIVVGPPYASDVRAELERIAAAPARPDLHVVDNPTPERGMASSVSLGFAQLERVAPPSVAVALLWPVDHPFVRDETLRALIAAFVDPATGSDPISGEPTEVVRPRYGERGGHPPLIARAVWSALADCAKDPQGARGVLATRRTRDIIVEDMGVIRDVDTPADLER